MRSTPRCAKTKLFLHYLSFQICSSIKKPIFIRGHFFLSSPCTSRIETDGHNSPVPSTLSWITSTNTQSPSQSFVLARKAIEANIDRNRKKDRKRMKLHDKSGKSTEVTTNIGIMTKRENVLVVKRGVALSVTVRKTINY